VNEAKEEVMKVFDDMMRMTRPASNGVAWPLPSLSLRLNNGDEQDLPTMLERHEARIAALAIKVEELELWGAKAETRLSRCDF